MLAVKKFGMLVSVVGLVASGISFGGTAENAGNLKQGIAKAKASVDHMIASVNGGGGNGGGNGGGGSDPWMIEDQLDDMLENDAVALPILIQASTTLGTAGSLADRSKLAFLAGNFDLGNYRFAQSCSKMGISRSQVARANTAALMPPSGLLAAFSSDMGDVVTELNALRLSEGCP